MGDQGSETSMKLGTWHMPDKLGKVIVFGLQPS
jgi:hypothetical protein